jgi:DNA-binding response OmpR family regulator
METANRHRQHKQVSAAGAARHRERRGRRSRASLEIPEIGVAAEGVPRVGVLDSDSGFLLVLSKRLERADWQHTVLPARITLKALSDVQADALILDLDVLGEKRWSWLERFCERRPDVRVVICTAASTPAERVRALSLGADDWLSKPCHPEELMARVEAVTMCRKRQSTRNLDPVIFGEVQVRPDQFQAFVNGLSLRLTRREYQLIELLARSDGEILTRERIYECLWGYEMVRNDRSVDVFVHKLRRKLERASPVWSYIQTHFGVGYQLDPKQVSESGESSALDSRELLAA